MPHSMRRCRFMSIDPRLTDLVARIGAFHITHRATKAAQRAIEAAIRDGEVDESTLSDYLRAVRRYFAGFDREARAHLRDVDRRLERVNQIHFNLAAERAVAVKRIEGTQGVLETLDSLEARNS
jgi:flavin-dependent dehydrogenase